MAPGAVEGDGLAVNEVIAGSGITFTVIVAAAVTEPAVFVAVMVYVVVVAGETLSVPFNATAPTPLLIITEVAFSTVHASVADCPLVMLAGVAENRMIRGTWPGVTATAIEQLAGVPDVPVVVRV